jgi:hypothetical protein
MCHNDSTLPGIPPATPASGVVSRP